MGKHTGQWRRRAAGLCGMLCLLVVLVLGLAEAFAAARDVQHVSDMDRIRKYYTRVNETLPSRTNATANETIIRNRLACYAEHADYNKRVKICNGRYTRDLVKSLRAAIRSQPDIGNFLVTVSVCPVIYNLCAGKTDDEERCVLFERQCIDSALDIFWRGVLPVRQQPDWIGQ